METTYKVQGMTCGGCVKSLTRALETAMPGKIVEVTLPDGLVRVEGEHDPAAIAQAVEDSGFDFMGRV